MLLILVLFSCLQVLWVRFWAPPTTMYMLSERLFGDTPVAYTWVPRSKLSRNLARAVLAAEDQRFFNHHGFDWVEIRHAVDDGLDGGNWRGASTITMQTARNLYLWPGRNLVRKGLEAWYTVLMELFLPKNRILELYLNVAEFGPGTFGAEAAARKFYKKPAASLTQGQAAGLAAVLPSPKHRSPHRDSRYRQRILRTMRYMAVPGWGD